MSGAFAITLAERCPTEQAVLDAEDTHLVHDLNIVLTLPALSYTAWSPAGWAAR